jgi:hypothetical protein
MTELELAIERLERAVARLEAGSGAIERGREADDPRLREIASEITARIDLALAKISRVLGEGG